MMKNIIDLHMHSLYSDDGEYTPGELMTLCKDAGLKFAALADHNSVKGVEEAIKEGEKLGIKVIPAIEIDCIYNGVNLHVLGYYIDPKFPRFYELEEDILRQEQTASPKRVELIEKSGIYVNPDKIKKLSKDGIITGEMIAEAALYEPENKDNEVLKPYLAGGSRSDNPYVNFYWDFCAQGKIAYAHVNFISLTEALDIINKAGGTPILAQKKKNVHEDKVLLHGIIEQGVKGMEVYSSYHTPEQVSFYRKEAEELNILMTCGSDFHGKTKPSIKLGDCKCDKDTESEIIEKFIRN